MAETKDWKKLSDYNHARLRTEMYLGSRDPHTQTVLEYPLNSNPTLVETTWVPALFTAFREVLDNALDEIITHGHGDKVEITYNPETMECSISDNGRGIPINWDETEKNWAATVLLSETKAGRNFEDDRADTRGLNGVGASIVNFCSEYFQIEVERDGKKFDQKFSEGEELVIEEPMIFPTSKKAKKTGTKVSFKLSSKVFKNFILPETFIKSRIFEVSLCFPKLKIIYNGKSIEAPTIENLFSNYKPISIKIDQEGFVGQFWLIPDFVDKGEHHHSMVNAIPTFNGGTHVDAFKRNFYSGLLTALEKQSKRMKLEPNKSDISEGLLSYSIINMTAPSFDSQSKSRLISEHVGKIIQRTLDDPEFFKGLIKKYPEWIAKIYERCAERTTKKDDEEARKAAKKNKRKKVKDLDDASGQDRSKCILLLTEGLSAAGGAIEARNPDIHGILPLGGKTLNVWGVSNREILADVPLSNIMNAIGLIPGDRINRHMLRYGKVYITADADPDGYNIGALLVNFFYSLFPDLFDPQNPFVYIFETPLIIAKKGKSRAYWYSDNYHEFNPEKYRGYSVTRAKGLAALEKDDWAYVLANPKLTPIVKDEQMSETMTLLFSKVKGMTDLRKDWIGL